MPQSETVQFLKRRLGSAHEALHGVEATATFPSPLRAGEYPGLSVAIDHIFFSPASLRPVDVRLMGNFPAAGDDTVCASDHFGVLAEFAFA